MTEKIGVVVNVVDDRTAEVMTDKKGACGGCADTRSCKSCLSGGDKIVAMVQNAPGARAGDLVAVEHTKGALWTGAALFYVLPVFGLMVGAFAGVAISGGWGMEESDGAVLLGMIGLAAGLLSVFFLSRSEYARTRLVPRIVRIVEHGEGRPSLGIQKRRAATVRSCCG